ncbi:hypothetical protein EDC30_1118 [Paucimonas lemoignei]|uniref:Uncharacterized protein n=1 Tax=Paucimonas lemoignei TaxID=29443 RepID=A0A4R3HQQ7_PAULE|nr:hypothetical protein [Paucimonas lemoignei]TCS35095.1 hypothetical protein EDC30_1118 [Paucimonas lemoignei]
MSVLNQPLQKRWIVDYLQATDNEILFDEYDYRSLNLTPDTCGFLPRPTKWIGRLHSRFWFSKLAWRIGLLIWSSGGAAVYHSIQFLRYFIQASKQHGEMPLSSCRHFALAFSSRAAEVINSHSVPGFSACWITFPWAPVNQLPADANHIDVFSLLSARDLILALRHAMVSTQAMSYRADTKKWLLHSYTAFRWFASRAALEKLEGDFYIAEHYDRWAVLADGVIHNRLRPRGTGGSMSHLSLIQHGRVEGLSDPNQAPQFHMTLKRRLKAVSFLYVYDQTSENIFRESILSTHCIRRGIRVNHFRPQIVLQEESLPTNSASVLFVGHPACESLHVFLLQELKRKYSINAFYKPHPLMPMSTELVGQDWKVITEKSHFPRVQFLVSYPSTLVVEYASSGIPAVVHPIDLSVQNYDAFKAEIIAHIERHG